MPKSKASKRRIDQYAGNSPQLRDSGFLVKLGGSDEIAPHYRHHLHQFLDYLSERSFWRSSNPLDQVGDREHALRDAKRRAGIAGR